MTTIKVLRSGDAFTVVLPHEVVQRLGLHDGDELSVVDLNDGLELHKGRSSAERQRESAQRVLKTHARTFERLAQR